MGEGLLPICGHRRPISSWQSCGLMGIPCHSPMRWGKGRLVACIRLSLPAAGAFAGKSGVWATWTRHCTQGASCPLVPVGHRRPPRVPTEIVDPPQNRRGGVSQHALHGTRASMCRHPVPFPTHLSPLWRGPQEVGVSPHRGREESCPVEGVTRTLWARFIKCSVYFTHVTLYLSIDSIASNEHFHAIFMYLGHVR